MRLLFLTEHFPPGLGGVAASAGRTAHALAGIGVQVDVVTWTRALAPGMTDATGENPRVFRIGRYREWDSTMPHTSNLCDWLWSEQPYDSLWGHYLAPAGFFAVWLGQLKKVPSVVSIRGNDLDRDVFPPGDFARLRWTLEHAHVVTTVTRELASKVTAVTGRTDVLHLPNAVDHDVFRPMEPSAELREGLGILPGELVLGFCGELREKKGQRQILEALGYIRERRPACLLIVGEVRPSQMPQLLEFTGTEPPAAHRILITGPLSGAESVNQHLQLCDLYLQPSLWDGMPNALLEAMAAGCCVIASDAGGIPEIVQDRKNGILVPRWKLGRLGEVIQAAAVLDKTEVHRMRASARKHVVEHFDFEQERRRLQAVMARLAPAASYRAANSAPARVQE